jgi:hypothetical protein
MNRGVVLLGTTVAVVLAGLIAVPLFTKKKAPEPTAAAPEREEERSTLRADGRSLLDLRPRDPPKPAPRTSTVALKTPPPPDPSAPDYGAALVGLDVSNATSDELAQLKVPEGMTGVIVKHVDPSSPAAEATLKKGDVIVRAQRDKISSSDSLLEAVNTRAYTLLTVYRDGYPFQVVLHKPAKPGEQADKP